jgi:hypothetical protein
MERKSGRGRGLPPSGHIKVQFNIRPEINRMIVWVRPSKKSLGANTSLNLVEAAFRLSEGIFD